MEQKRSVKWALLYKKEWFGGIKYKILTRKVKHISLPAIFVYAKVVGNIWNSNGKNKNAWFYRPFLHFVFNQTGKALFLGPFFLKFAKVVGNIWSGKAFLSMSRTKNLHILPTIFILTGNLYLNFSFLRFRSLFLTFLTGFIFVLSAVLVRVF